jgi:hypothetical protein
MNLRCAVSVSSFDGETALAGRFNDKSWCYGMATVMIYDVVVGSIIGWLGCSEEFMVAGLPIIANVMLRSYDSLLHQRALRITSNNTATIILVNEVPESMN